MSVETRPLADALETVGHMDVTCVRFGEHFVVVRSPADVTADFRAAFGAMVLDGRAGSCAGELELQPSTDGFRVHGAPPGEDPPSTASLAWATRELCHATIKLMMLARSDLVWVHGGVVGRAGRAHLFSGAAGQGKSTMVGEFLARGWSYCSDEVAAIDPERAIVHPFPLAPRRRVHEGDFRWLDDVEAVRRLPKIEVELPSQAIASQAVPLERLWFLHYCRDERNVEIAPCSPADAVLEMLRNSLSITEDRRREIAGLARLAAQVPAFRMRYPSAGAAAEHIHGMVAESPRL